MKTIVVTGGAGFIGSNLCARLIAGGDKVIALDNLYTGYLENLDELKNESRFSFENQDVLNPIDIKCDRIFHLACPASPPHYQKDPIYTFKTAVLGTLNALECARKNNGRVLIASTSEIYGDPDQHPQHESYRGNVNTIGPRSCYDEGKRAGETLAMDFRRSYKTSIKIIRIFNTYGPKMDPLDGRVVSNFIVQALKNQPITTYGDGSQTRSFCYVDDLVDGIIRMMESPEDFTGPVNLGNPGEFTIKELGEKVLAKTKSASKFVRMPLPEDDPRKRKPDISLALEKLGWQPKIALEEGLDKTIEYFRTRIQKEGI